MLIARLQYQFPLGETLHYLRTLTMSGSSLRGAAKSGQVIARRCRRRWPPRRARAASRRRPG